MEEEEQQGSEEGDPLLAPLQRTSTRTSMYATPSLN